jgi:hypothetical protein
MALRGAHLGLPISAQFERDGNLDFAMLTRKERSMDAHERPVVTEENKVAVRAGSTGHHVRYVLIGSVALAILAWILVEVFVRP